MNYNRGGTNKSTPSNIPLVGTPDQFSVINTSMNMGSQQNAIMDNKG